MQLVISLEKSSRYEWSHYYYKESFKLGACAGWHVKFNEQSSTVCFIVYLGRMLEYIFSLLPLMRTDLPSWTHAQYLISSKRLVHSYTFYNTFIIVIVLAMIIHVLCVLILCTNSLNSVDVWINSKQTWNKSVKQISWRASSYLRVASGRFKFKESLSW